MRGQYRLAIALSVALPALWVGGLLPLRARGGESALAQGQQLFQKNRWREARRHLRATWPKLSASDRAIAHFVIGRSYIREAELYGWLRRFGNEVGLDYLAELAAQNEHRDLRWLPLFRGAYQLDAGRYEDAARSLRKAAALESLPGRWREIARRRARVAEHLRDPAKVPLGLDSDGSAEARYWRVVLEAPRGADGVPAKADSKQAPAGGSSGPEVLFRACALFRAGEPESAEALLGAIELDSPAVEDHTDPNTLLRFYDPLVIAAHQRTLWERARTSLSPLARGRPGPQASLASFYSALALYHLGEFSLAREELERARATDLGAAQGVLQDLLAVALAPAPPAAEARAALWRHVRTDPEALLFWSELARSGAPGFDEPDAAVDAALAALEAGHSARIRGATAGRWGLTLLDRRVDAEKILPRLSKLRDNANKNRIEHNDPLLLLALAVANYRLAAYPQSLETAYALSDVFPGLRAVHWNLQGTYAARQSTGGEARISR